MDEEKKYTEADLQKVKEEEIGEFTIIFSIFTIFLVLAGIAGTFINF